MVATAEVGIAIPVDRDAAVAVVTAAFIADPVLRWVFPDAQEYLSTFPQLVKAFAGKSFDENTADSAEDLAGVALWIPPGAGPGEEATGELMARRIPASRQGEIFGFLEQMAPFHPEEPHWYLPFIGVDPARQGQGLGSALLWFAARRADETGTPSYLEASSSENKRLYERYGFRAIGVIQEGNSPPMWPMVREPR